MKKWWKDNLFHKSCACSDWIDFYSYVYAYFSSGPPRSQSPNGRSRSKRRPRDWLIDIRHRILSRSNEGEQLTWFSTDFRGKIVFCFIVYQKLIHKRTLLERRMKFHQYLTLINKITPFKASVLCTLKKRNTNTLWFLI